MIDVSMMNAVLRRLTILCGFFIITGKFIISRLNNGKLLYQLDKGDFICFEEMNVSKQAELDCQ